MVKDRFVLCVLPDHSLHCIHLRSDFSFDAKSFTSAVSFPNFSPYLISQSTIERLPTQGRFVFPKSFVMYPYLYRLQFLPSGFPPQILRFSLESNLQHPLAPLFLSVPIDSSINFHDILRAISSSYFIKPSSATIKFDKKKPNSIDVPLSQNLVSMRKTRMVINFTFPISNITKRINVSDEIISTEETYVKLLEQSPIKFNEDFFVASGASADVFSRTFKAFFEILPMHKSFLNALSPMKSSLEAPIGQLFLHYLPFFKVAAPHIANFKASAAELSTILDTNLIFQSKAKMISETYFDGLSVESILITPVQRIARYPLLLKELLKMTPESHWDFIPLKEALEKMISLSKFIDEKRKEQEQLDALVTLQSEIGNSYSVLSPHRRLIASSLKSAKSIAYLFNDAILIHQKSPQSFLEVPILNVKFSLSVNFISIESRDFEVENPGDFVTKFVQAKRNFVLGLSSLGQAVVWQSFQDIKAKLSGASITSKGSFCYIFGGIEAGVAQNGLYIVSHSQWLRVEAPNAPLPRFDCSSSCVGSKIYVFGGQGSDIFSDFMCFDTEANQWMKKPGCPIARAGHSSAVRKGKIYIFGGRKADGVLLNDLYCYDTQNEKWNQIKCEISPSPRQYASLFPCGQGLALCGGKCENENFGDFWIFEGNKWTIVKTSGQRFSPRYGHCGAEVNDSIFIVGGKNGESSLLQSMRLDARKWEWNKVTESGAPRGLIEYSICESDDSGFSIYGVTQAKAGLWRIPLRASIHDEVKKAEKELTPLAICNGLNLSRPMYNAERKTLTVSVNDTQSVFDCIVDFDCSLLSSVVDISHRVPVWKESAVYQYEGMEPIEDDAFSGKVVFEI